MQQFKDRFNLDQNEVTKTTQARAIVALIAIAGMFLPWVWLDGDTSPMNAAQLLAYAFTNPERGAMISISFPGPSPYYSLPRSSSASPSSASSRP